MIEATRKLRHYNGEKYWLRTRASEFLFTSW